MTKCIAHNVHECAECRSKGNLFYRRGPIPNRYPVVETASESLYPTRDDDVKQPFLFEVGPTAPSPENVTMSFTAPPVGPLFLMGPGMNEVLRLEAGGDVYVRGEKVDSNVKVYEAFKEWLTAVGVLK